MKKWDDSTQNLVRVDSTSIIGLYIEEAEEFVVILQRTVQRFAYRIRCISSLTGNTERPPIVYGGTHI